MGLLTKSDYISKLACVGLLLSVIFVIGPHFFFSC